MLHSVKPKDRLGNKLLAALPGEEYKHILPDLEQTYLYFDESIYESSERLNYAYFPITSVVSLVYTMLDGASAEMGMVGDEGLIGIALLTGGETRPNRAIALHAGSAIRMKASAFREEFRRGGAFQRLSLRYIQALLTQVSQRAVCNGLHSIEQRLACWLLMTHDRVGSEKRKSSRRSKNRPKRRRAPSMTKIKAASRRSSKMRILPSSTICSLSGRAMRRRSWLTVCAPQPM
jgi:CRP-like cAMP-binding protein